MPNLGGDIKSVLSSQRPPAGKYQPVLAHGRYRFFLLALLRANAWAVAHPSG